MRLLASLLLAASLLLPALTLVAQEQGGAAEESVSLASLVALPELLERAAQATRSGDHPQAILDYSLFLLFNPTLGQAWHGRGLSYLQTGDLVRAMVDFDRALEFSLAPRDQAAVLVDRAEGFLRQERFGDALADLDSAIELWPEETFGRMLRARLHEIEGRPEAAIEDYDELRLLLPERSDVLVERGIFHLRLGDREAAARDFNEAVALFPEDSYARLERAVFLAEAGEFEAALADIEVAMQLDTSNLGLYLFRASLLGDSGAQQESAAGYLQWLNKIRLDTIRQNDLLAQGDVTVSMAPGRSYIFSFEGRQGDTLTASATSLTSGEVDSLLVLTDAAGAALVADDDGGGALDARIEGYVLPADGAYRLILGHAGGPSEGPLRVNLSLN
ncbi:MAG: tetratricopeptide repeat protein [Anaerolineaceae bacterium]|nr:tetratricopeptide repeat protein [Anaerolineaceae bacterium]